MGTVPYGTQAQITAIPGEKVKRLQLDFSSIGTIPVSSSKSIYVYSDAKKLHEVLMNAIHFDFSQGLVGATSGEIFLYIQVASETVILCKINFDKDFKVMSNILIETPYVEVLPTTDVQLISEVFKSITFDENAPLIINIANYTDVNLDTSLITYFYYNITAIEKTVS